MRRSSWIFAALLLACSKGSTGSTGSTEPPGNRLADVSAAPAAPDGGSPTAAEPPSVAPSISVAAPSAAPVSSRECVGLGKSACVLRPGCILDQPKRGTYVCRSAKNACESAVRHADIIGTDVRGVKDADVKRAYARCTATSGCVVGGGDCACSCTVFGADCDCYCSGGWLRRCVPRREASQLSEYR